MADVELLLENVGFVQRFTLVSNASAVSITGAVITWQIQQRSLAISVVSAGSGVVEYTQSATDFQAAGEWTTRLLVSYSASQRFYTDTFTLKVGRAT